MSRESWVLFLVAAVSACSDGTLPSAPPPPPPPITVAVAYCSGLEPTWVAFQDGDGAWTQAQPIVSGPHTTFRYAFSAKRGGIATTTLFRSGITSLSVQYGTPAELTMVGDTNPRDCGPVVSKTLLGAVAGLATNESAFLMAGSSRAVVRQTVGDSFDFFFAGIPCQSASRSCPPPGPSVAWR